MLMQYRIVGHFSVLNVVPSIIILYQSSIVVRLKAEIHDFKTSWKECNSAAGVCSSNLSLKIYKPKRQKVVIRKTSRTARFA